MEKATEEFAYGSFFLQAFVYALIIAIIFFIFKLYIGIMRNLDNE